MATFTYTPFSNSHSIRILTLSPSPDPSSPLIGTLSEQDLDSGASDTYEAISYVWGQPSRSAAISCNGLPLKVTQSIHDALARVRLTDKPRRLWADQICINQDDLAERSRQVELMNLVYKNAQQVLVWLGHDVDEVAERAMGLIRHLHGVFEDEEANRAFQKACSEDLPKESAETWSPLAALTHLPWFHRIWIVQEIGTAAPATLYWGTASIDWETLSTVVGVLNKEYHHLRSRFYIGTPNLRYLYRRFVEPLDAYDEYHNRGSFVYELHRARQMLAEDPRDHVYAFLGHFSLGVGSPSLSSLVADYTRPMEDVFCDVAIRALTDADSLILLCATHNEFDSSQPRRDRQHLSIPSPSLPSWVPDWRGHPRHIFGTPQTPHLACGNTKPTLSIDPSSLTLRIAGIHIDTIARKSWILHGKAFRILHHANLPPSPVESLWRRIIHGDTPINLSTPYIHNNHSSFFALVQTLTNGCIGMNRVRPYESIPEEEWLAHAAAYLIRAKQPKSPIDDDLHELARTGGGDAFKWSHEATLVTRYRCFAITAQGYYVLGPHGLQQGDVVAILHGGRTPFLMRRRGDHDSDGWTLVGECYVHGLMNGEALEMKGAVQDTFVIH